MKLTGVDIGGTFTDLFSIDEDRGVIQVAKVSSTSLDPSDGVMQAFNAGEIRMDEVGLFLHGTTIATNIMIERKGAKCALITTKGFRDVTELGRRDRPYIYGLTGTQNPLIPRDRRFEVTERINYKGQVVEPLNEWEVKKIAGYLLDLEVESVIVSFLHSYANPTHEVMVREMLRRANENWYVVISSDVLKEYYEFERTSTAVVEGYLRPAVAKYASNLKRRMGAANYKGGISIIQSNGGVLSLDLLEENASNIVRSGPAAGVIAASYIAKEAGYENIITGDMGGTSFDVALVLNGVPKVTEQVNLDFRVPLRRSMIDVHTIGAGGGSIAWVDRGHILRVGPWSAGSTPGPACYGKGGTHPTVTDANLVLGRIDPDQPIGNVERLSRSLAETAIRKHVAEPLEISVIEAAEAILRIVNSNMAGRIRTLSIERGYDPRDFVFVAFGGAGPLHAASLIKEIGILKALIPRYPGVLCALGCVLADVQYDFVQTINLPQRTWDLGVLGNIVEEKIMEGRKRLSAEPIHFERIDVNVFADMAYEGQIHTVRVPLTYPLWSIKSIVKSFEETFMNTFGSLRELMEIILINLRVQIIGKRKRLDLASLADERREEGGAFSPREQVVYFDGKDYNVPVINRSMLTGGTVMEGPLLIQQADTTVLVEPGMKAEVDKLGNILISI